MQSCCYFGSVESEVQGISPGSGCCVHEDEEPASTKTKNQKNSSYYNTIQTVKGKGSSPLELRAFQNCLQDLDSVGFVVNTVATDRNKQVAKWIRTERPEIVHKYYPWHFSKNIKSKLRPLAKRKACKIIQEWIKPIGNHLFWCTENCGEDPEKLKQMWKSLLHHICNKHKFTKTYPKYSACLHKTFSKEKVRKTKWIKKYSPTYNVIEKVIFTSKS